MIIRRYFPMFVSIVAAMILLSFTASDAAQLAAAEEKGTVTGRVMIMKGLPLSGGQVMFYNASSGVLLTPERVPDVSGDLDAEGAFKVTLKAGKYYLGAVKRMTSERIGPPQKGDYVFRSLDEQGKPKEYIIKAGEILDAGELLGAEPVKAEALAKKPPKTAIEGTVFDMAGKPVVDAVVVAFTTPTLKGKPLFVSDRTDKDGKYLLRLEPGTYYLRARNSFNSGPPEPGQIVGYYGEGTPAPVTVKKDEIVKGADFKVILFPGRGPFSGAGPE
jgi:hypothetical protein